MLTAATVGALAVLVSILSQIPQVLRALRTRVTDGLSTGTIALSVLCCALWAAYGVGIHDPAQIVNNVASLLLLAVLGWVLVLTGGMRRWQAPTLVAGSLLLAVTICVLLSPAAAAAAGTAVGLVSRLPQVRVALTDAPLWGLDPWAVLLSVVNPLVWVGYGVLSGTPIVILSSALSVVLSTIIGWRRLPPRRTLWSLSEGRLGPVVARAVSPLSGRFPHTDLVRAA